MWKAGFSKAMTGAVLKGGIGALGKFGLKTLIPKLIGFLGGPWIAAIMWLPEICHLCRWIWGKFKGEGRDKQNFTNWSNWLSTMGVSQSNTLATLKLLQQAYNESGGKMSAQELQKKASYYLGKEASRDIVVNDNGQIMLQFNGSFLTYEELQDMIKRATLEDNKKKEGFWSNLFNKPRKGDDLLSSF
jgi:hypothetical protein